LYDSLTTSYYYKYAAESFTAYNSLDPVGFLNFKGRWGDAEYPEDDERQKGKGLLGFKKFVGGPTGVGEKYVYTILQESGPIIHLIFWIMRSIAY